MSKRQFVLIVDYIGQDLSGTFATALKPEEQLGLFLLYVSHGIIICSLPKPKPSGWRYLKDLKTIVIYHIALEP
jgi:hypothetical protein